ncbi:uncharacterized protein MONOS_15490 [Monocercomonoides exilis]|uniref:uncharacterized protein n=1 Tax=Monocercomonoides exilis TaxID=2049356 RepID=UPI003559C5C3|nr:hypothetical protein MONOS_15490 [Monocercomonoides exilis]|eukprot:MONOS_15490.1-p1 / transcript=MONOS_15490.1 / gene=MONOS_15490 / organism=Monocercomonoides_exilis_PA203 / gene_product=unspecified product / transcript_product=unspecified product / location=Mono_scaffold01249:6636-11799(+) / protein_length=1570 / sequence_SO=supercontig / SO=protein_coding / is_pseudo=false
MLKALALFIAVTIAKANTPEENETPWFISSVTSQFARSMRRLCGKENEASHYFPSFLRMFYEADKTSPGVQGLFENKESQSVYKKSIIISMIPTYVIWGVLLFIIIGSFFGSLMKCCNPKKEKPFCRCCCWERGYFPCKVVTMTVTFILSIIASFFLIVATVGILIIPSTIYKVNDGMSTTVNFLSSLPSDLSAVSDVFASSSEIFEDYLKPFLNESSPMLTWHTSSYVFNPIRDEYLNRDNPFTKANPYWTLRERERKSPSEWDSLSWRGKKGWTSDEVLERMLLEEQKGAEEVNREIFDQEFEKNGYIDNFLEMLHILQSIKIDITYDPVNPSEVIVTPTDPNTLTSEINRTIAVIVDAYLNHDAMQMSSLAEADDVNKQLREKTVQAIESMESRLDQRGGAIERSLIKLVTDISATRNILSYDQSLPVNLTSFVWPFNFTQVSIELSNHVTRAKVADSNSAKMREELLRVLHRLRCAQLVDMRNLDTDTSLSADSSKNSIREKSNFSVGSSTFPIHPLAFADYHASCRAVKNEFMPDSSSSNDNLSRSQSDFNSSERNSLNYQVRASDNNTLESSSNAISAAMNNSIQNPHFLHKKRNRMSQEAEGIVIVRSNLSVIPEYINGTAILQSYAEQQAEIFHSDFISSIANAEQNLTQLEQALTRIRESSNEEKISNEQTEQHLNGKHSKVKNVQHHNKIKDDNSFHSNSVDLSDSVEAIDKAINPFVSTFQKMIYFTYSLREAPDLFKINLQIISNEIINSPPFQRWNSFFSNNSVWLSVICYLFGGIASLACLAFIVLLIVLFFIRNPTLKSLNCLVGCNAAIAVFVAVPMIVLASCAPFFHDLSYFVFEEAPKALETQTSQKIASDLVIGSEWGDYSEYAQCLSDVSKARPFKSLQDEKEDEGNQIYPQPISMLWMEPQSSGSGTKANSFEQNEFIKNNIETRKTNEDLNTQIIVYSPVDVRQHYTDSSLQSVFSRSSSSNCDGSVFDPLIKARMRSGEEPYAEQRRASPSSSVFRRFVKKTSNVTSASAVETGFLNTSESLFHKFSSPLPNNDKVNLKENLGLKSNRYAMESASDIHWEMLRPTKDALPSFYCFPSFVNRINRTNLVVRPSNQQELHSASNSRLISHSSFHRSSSVSTQQFQTPKTHSPATSFTSNFRSHHPSDVFHLSSPQLDASPFTLISYSPNFLSEFYSYFISTPSIREKQNATNPLVKALKTQISSALDILESATASNSTLNPLLAEGVYLQPPFESRLKRGLAETKSAADRFVAQGEQYLSEGRVDSVIESVATPLFVWLTRAVECVWFGVFVGTLCLTVQTVLVLLGKTIWVSKEELLKKEVVLETEEERAAKELAWEKAAEKREEMLREKAEAFERREAEIVKNREDDFLEGVLVNPLQVEAEDETEGEINRSEDNDSANEDSKTNKEEAYIDEKEIEMLLDGELDLSRIPQSKWKEAKKMLIKGIVVRNLRAQEQERRAIESAKQTQSVAINHLTASKHLLSYTEMEAMPDSEICGDSNIQNEKFRISREAKEHAIQKRTRKLNNQSEKNVHSLNNVQIDSFDIFY